MQPPEEEKKYIKHEALKITKCPKNKSARLDLHGSQCNIPRLDYTALPNLKRENRIVLMCRIKHLPSLLKNTLIMNCQTQSIQSQFTK